MRPPWIEHTALLGAHGHAVSVLPLSVIRNMLRRPAMPHAARYALVREPQVSTHKPTVFHALHGLAQSVHRQARGGPVQLEDAYLEFAGETSPRKGVNVWALDPLTMDKTAFIGWAWLDGGDRTLLSAAMPRRQGGVSAIRAA